jgi:hypothetical protein
MFIESEQKLDIFENYLSDSDVKTHRNRMGFSLDLRWPIYSLNVVTYRLNSENKNIGIEHNYLSTCLIS